MKQTSKKNTSSVDMAVDVMDSKINSESVEIMPMDVLCGRGKNSFNHVGNRKFRDIVAEAIPGYVTATSRATKSEIVTSIVRQVRESGGRFLKRDGKKGGWFILNYTQSKEKAGHAIRDATITEESKKERAKKRKLQRAAAAENSRKSPLLNMDQSLEMTVSVPMPKPEPMMSITPDSSVCSLADTSSVPEAPSDNELSPDELFGKDFTITCDHVKSLDDNTPSESLSGMLMAHFPEKLYPEEIPPSTAATSFEPLSIDDPFNSYIDQLLGGPISDF